MLLWCLLRPGWNEGDQLEYKCKYTSMCGIWGTPYGFWSTAILMLCSICEGHDDSVPFVSLCKLMQRSFKALQRDCQPESLQWTSVGAHCAHHPQLPVSFVYLALFPSVATSVQPPKQNVIPEGTSSRPWKSCDTRLLLLMCPSYSEIIHLLFRAAVSGYRHAGGSAWPQRSILNWPDVFNGAGWLCSPELHPKKSYRSWPLFPIWYPYHPTRVFVLHQPKIFCQSAVWEL